MSNINPIISTLVWPSFANSIDLLYCPHVCSQQYIKKVNLNFCVAAAAAVVAAFYLCDISVCSVIQMNVVSSRV